MALHVPGRPRPKGSLKNTCRKDRKHTIRSEEQVKGSKAWKEYVAAYVQRWALQQYGRHLQVELPVELRVVYFFDRTREDRPKELYPVAMEIGDLDKLDRNIGDALVSSGLIKDDQYIVRIESRKMWGKAAGAQITLMQAPDPDDVLTGGLA